MNPKHKTFIFMDVALKKILRQVSVDIKEYGVEGAYDLLHARNQETILRQQMMPVMNLEETIAACAVFAALQYIEALFIHEEVEDACKMD